MKKWFQSLENANHKKEKDATLHSNSSRRKEIEARTMAFRFGMISYLDYDCVDGQTGEKKSLSLSFPLFIRLFIYFPDDRDRNMRRIWRWCTHASQPTRFRAGRKRIRCGCSPTMARSTPCAATSTTWRCISFTLFFLPLFLLSPSLSSFTKSIEIFEL